MVHCHALLSLQSITRQSEHKRHRATNRLGEKDKDADTFQIFFNLHLIQSQTCSVDMGFIVCNPLTYPNFLNFAKHVGFQLDKSDMSFAVSKKIISNTNSRKSKSLNDNADDITLDTKFEWAGRNLRSMFAQKSNLIPSLSRVVPECLDEIVKSYLGVEVDRKSGDMYVLVKDIFRFHDLASKIADESDGLQKPEGAPLPIHFVLDSSHQRLKLSFGKIACPFNFLPAICSLVRTPQTIPLPTSPSLNSLHATDSQPFSTRTTLCQW